mgnify:CR=1 FL=1
MFWGWARTWRLLRKLRPQHEGEGTLLWFLSDAWTDTFEEHQDLATVSALVRHLVETQQLRSGRAGQAGGQTSMSELKGSDF